MRNSSLAGRSHFFRTPRGNNPDQVLDLQHDAMLAAGVDERHLFEDRASGSRDNRAGLEKALAFLKPGDCLVVWKLLYSGKLQSLHRHLFSFRLPMSGTQAA